MLTVFLRIRSTWAISLRGIPLVNNERTWISGSDRTGRGEIEVGDVKTEHVPSGLDRFQNVERIEMVCKQKLTDRLGGFLVRKNRISGTFIIRDTHGVVWRKHS